MIQIQYGSIFMALVHIYPSLMNLLFRNRVMMKHSLLLLFIQLYHQIHKISTSLRISKHLAIQ